MAVYSTFSKTVFGLCLLTLGACSSANDAELFGYDDNFAAPEPDMVPVTPDDRPGRTVDEMLDVNVSAATVNKGDYRAPAETDKMYEHAGRFGSKEKIALRKGLNAPDSGIVYGGAKRRAADVVRPLELKEQEKDGLAAMSDNETLAEIIAPKPAQVEMVEVVAAKKREERAEQSQTTQTPMPEIVPLAPSEPEPAVVPELAAELAAEPAPESDAAAVPVTLPMPQPSRPVAIGEPLVEPAPAPMLTWPDPAAEPERETFVLTPPEKEAAPVLTPPSQQENESGFVLIPPAAEEAESSVDVFIVE